ncbi:MAG: peptidylprolyl isomerase [Planctomycetes bacterium]|nr:peptidylprolyl isomerase [Planctomycetota bacterium]MCW8135667.1 peptidylprolyl isomerase [Planctomycetota bacterium]
MAVTLKLDKPEYALGETIRAEVTVTNEGKVAADYPAPELALPSVSLHVIRRPDAPTPESHLVRIKGAGKVVKLAPGKSASGVIEFPAVDPHGQLIEAYYAPRGDIRPDFSGTDKETSNRVPVRVHAHGKKLHAVIHTEAGPIKLEFFADRAMNHVLSFVQLAQSGYFNGIVFHRVVPRFVIQGGDPTGTGSGGPGYKLPAEFNEIPHVPGILSMARTSDPHSAGSQFFICTDDCPNLDEQYTVFGRVVEGLDAVMTIGESDRNAGKYHMQKVEIIAE